MPKALFRMLPFSSPLTCLAQQTLIEGLKHHPKIEWRKIQLSDHASKYCSGKNFMLFHIRKHGY